MARTKKDQKRRSKQNWERGKRAPKKGNPRYKPVMVRTKKGYTKKVYKRRKKNNPCKKK